MLTWTWYFALSIIYWICSCHNELIDLGFRVLEVLGIRFDMWGFGWRFGICLFLLGLDLKYLDFALLEKTRIVTFVHYLQYLGRTHSSAWPDRTCWLLEIGDAYLGSRVDHVWCVCEKWEDHIIGSFCYSILDFLRVFGWRVWNIWKAWYLVCYRTFWALAEIEIHKHAGNNGCYCAVHLFRP